MEESSQGSAPQCRVCVGLTCADGEVGDVLVPEGLLVGGAVGQQTESRTTDHGDLRTVTRLVQQPLGGQLVVVKGAAAGGGRGGG